MCIYLYDLFPVWLSKTWFPHSQTCLPVYSLGLPFSLTVLFRCKIQLPHVKCTIQHSLVHSQSCATNSLVACFTINGKRQWDLTHCFYSTTFNCIWKSKSSSHEDHLLPVRVYKWINNKYADVATFSFFTFSKITMFNYWFTYLHYKKISRTGFTSNILFT